MVVSKDGTTGNCRHTLASSRARRCQTDIPGLPKSDTRLKLQDNLGMEFPITADEADNSYQALGAGRSLLWNSHRFQVAFVRSARRKYDAYSVRPSATIAWRLTDD